MESAILTPCIAARSTPFRALREQGSGKATFIKGAPCPVLPGTSHTDLLLSQGHLSLILPLGRPWGSLALEGWSQPLLEFPNTQPSQFALKAQ